MKSIVELDDTEWQQVMAIIATAPWREVNALLMKIGGQLQQQAANRQQTNNRPEVPAAQGEGASSRAN